MREIRFRVWNKNECKMYYNVEHTYDYGCYEKSDVMADNFGDLLYDLELIVEQYIGIIDKNGKKIYEGDVLKDGAIVKWFDKLTYDGGGALHSGFYCEKWLEYEDLDYHYGFDEEIEVVGNVHEKEEKQNE